MPITHIPCRLALRDHNPEDDRPIEAVIEDFSGEVREVSSAASDGSVAHFAAGLPRYEVHRKSIFPEITDQGVATLHTPVRAAAQLRPLRNAAAPHGLRRSE